MKDIWLIYSSKKGGHKYPASALAQYLGRHFPQFQPLVVNLFSFSRTLALFDSFGRFCDLYFPSLWRAGGKRLTRPNSLFSHLYRKTLKLTIGLSHSKSFLLRKNRPSLIISFQPELNICAPFFKRWFSCPFYSVVIDLLIHQLWVEKEVDRYYVPNEKAREELIRWDIPKEKIILSGLPLREGFKKIEGKALPELRSKWQIPEDKPCLLLMAGLLGKMVNFEEVIKSIGRSEESVSLMVVCGENRKKFLDYQKLAKTYPQLALIPFGRVEEIFELMAIADIIITKPSSGTISEACALGKKIILLSPTGGAYQDIRFAQFLEENGAAVWVKEMREVGEMVKKILRDKKLSLHLTENAKRLGERNLWANKIISESLLTDYQLGKF